MLKWGELLFNFLPELIGAGVGAFLGYWFGVRQERKMKKEEEKKVKLKTVNSLLEELEYNSFLLFEKSTVSIENIPADKTKAIPVDPLITSSYDSIVSSGRFSSLSSINQLHLSYFYEDCKKINRRLLYIESTSRIHEVEINNYIKQIKNIEKQLKDNIDDLIINIKSELQ